MKPEPTTEVIRDAMRFMGIPPNDHDAEAAAAIKCAWEMGYREPASLAHMAMKFMRTR